MCTMALTLPNSPPEAAVLSTLSTARRKLRGKRWVTGWQEAWVLHPCLQPLLPPVPQMAGRGESGSPFHRERNWGILSLVLTKSALSRNPGPCLPSSCHLLPPAASQESHPQHKPGSGQFQLRYLVPCGQATPQCSATHSGILSASPGQRLRTRIPPSSLWARCLG